MSAESGDATGRRPVASIVAVAAIWLQLAALAVGGIEGLVVLVKVLVAYPCAPRGLIWLYGPHMTFPVSLLLVVGLSVGQTRADPRRRQAWLVSVAGGGGAFLLIWLLPLFAPALLFGDCR